MLVKGQKCGKSAPVKLSGLSRAFLGFLASVALAAGLLAFPSYAKADESASADATSVETAQNDVGSDDGADLGDDSDASSETEELPTVSDKPEGDVAGEDSITEGQQFPELFRSLTAKSSALECSADTFYSITDSGSVVRIDGSAGYASDDTGISFGRRGQYNGLAIGKDGQVAYAFDRSSDQIAIKQWSTDGSVTTVGTINTSGNIARGSLIAGGMQPDDASKYYFGGYKLSGGGWVPSQVTFELYRYDSDSNSTDYLGSVPMDGLTRTGNGDLAFDAQGNMYILYHTGSTVRLSTVTADDLARAESNPGRTIRAQGSRNLNLGGLSSLNGVAFNGDGYIYVQNSSGNNAFFTLIDPANGDIKGSGSANLGGGGTDLASCTSFPTIELKKDIDGERANPSDQFTLEISKVGVNDPIAFGTTEGNGSGVQERQAGPAPAQPGAKYRLVEKAAEGADLKDYDTSFTCEGDEGIEKKGDYEHVVTVPNDSSAVSCVYTNKAKPVAAARVEKGPRPGDAVTVDSEGKAVLEYTVTVTNDDPKNLPVKTGSIKDDVLIPNNVKAIGDVDITFSADTGVEGTGVLNSIPVGDFVNGKQIEIAKDLLLPPGTKATFSIKVPVQVDADSTPQQWEELGECKVDQGQSTGGVRNGVLMDNDSDGAGNNIACIPVKKLEPTKITVLKENSQGVALDGAKFALYKAQLDESGKPVGLGDVVQEELSLVEGSTTSFTTEDLTSGYYYIVETKAPEGYSLLPTPIGFQLKWVADTKAYALELVDSKDHTAVVDSEGLILKVADTKEGFLPDSGGKGYLPFAALGLIILMLGAYSIRRVIK